MPRCTRPPLILTALSERESVCRMSNMVFNTRPLQSRWGNLAKSKEIWKRIRMHEVSIMAGNRPAGKYL